MYVELKVPVMLYQASHTESPLEGLLAPVEPGQPTMDAAGLTHPPCTTSALPLQVLPSPVPAALGPISSDKDHALIAL